ncbi:hypothetical protein LN42_01080 [Marinitoga sp. 1137]|uniref:ATP-binding protein n=1 Tax=Marinitoga sp. 1137 TaxID=1545835 RepID=UPI000950780C|nr:RNA-binding domain-containing protein [Marinitoga sp. 1137]APT75144.1 hypothetical protein LN42_01080 [Marinitoga sp. 1137]
MTLIEEIKKGENKKLEFKEKLSGNYNSFLKTVVAFANGSGGKIIFGIKDKTHEIIGIDDEEIFDLSDKISNLISEKCFPAIIPEIYIANVENKNLLVVEIFSGQLKPYYLKEQNNKKKVYIRVGATTRLADENIIKALEREKLNISYDEEILFDYPEESIDFQPIKTDFKKFTGKELNEIKMVNLKILKEYNKKKFLTIGGALLIGKDEFLEYAGIKCARFKGNSVNEFIDSKEFVGPLYKIVEEAINFSKVHIEKSMIITEIRRREKYIVPIEVIREAIINAVVHRDYSINSDIKLAIFDNRIEITSPGGLPGNLDVESIKDGRSEIRNKVIARFFKEIRYIEQWGTGIRRIIELCKLNGLKEPEFIDDGRYFKVIIYKIIENKEAFENTVPESAGKLPESAGKLPESAGKLPEINEDILKFLNEHGKITRSDVEKILNIKERQARNILKEYVEKGLLKRNGSGKNTYYTINPHS